MARKVKGKVVQMLSPENYIRQRARSLPLFECTVNTEWETSKMALLTIARRHSNGNITYGMFMVDLLCQGVKESHFQFNIPLNEYRENQAKQKEMMDFIPIEYNLAHNIVYAALAFAEDYEFKPHKMFSSTTRFMLEEDTDDIPLIDIECGLDGKPAFVRGLTEDDKADQRIIAHLEKVVGPGNFIVLSGPDDLDDFDMDLQDNLEEMISEFLEIYKSLNSLNRDQYLRYWELSVDLYSKLTDDPEFDECYDELDFLFDINLKDTHISNEMLGISDTNNTDVDDLRKLFSEIFYSAYVDPNNLKEKWEIYKTKAPDLPSTCFLELLLLEMETGGGYDEKIIEYSQRFPDYKLIRMLYLSDQISLGYFDDDDPVWQEIEKIDNFYRQKESLHEIEFFHYLLLMIYVYFDSENPSKINALHAVVSELGIKDQLKVFLESLIISSKANVVYNILTDCDEFDESDEEPF